MAKCPSEADLTAFLNESLPRERNGQLSRHIDGCALCQNRLDRLTEATQVGVAKYKELAPSEATEQVQSSSSSPDGGTHVLGVLGPTHPPLMSLPSIPGFDVLEEIGRGSLGVVYKARHQRLNRLVALKMILAGVAADGRVVQRFLFEAEILARVQHPQVVQVFEVDTYKGSSGFPVPYLAIELLEAGSLSTRLQELRKDEKRSKTSDEKLALVEPQVAAVFIEGIARAVHSAHLQGVIHRDLKPSNILFSNDFGAVMDPNTLGGKHNPTIPRNRDRLLTFLAKVTDFGLTKLTLEAWADLPNSGLIVGTPNYLAPEQVAGSSQIGPEADVYALGAILYECLAGRPPFEGSEPRSVMHQVANEAPLDVRSLCHEIDRDVDAIVMRCLAKNPRQRYASAADLANDLRRYLENKPTTARPLNIWEQFRLWAKRNKMWPV